MPHNIDASALLLAGGSGTRLWPLSRVMYPKQVVRFIDNQSLIQHTLNRLLPAFSPDKIQVVCGNTHALNIQNDAQEINCKHDRLIVNEPCGRNTAPAILLGTLYIYETDPDAVIFVFPADHSVDRLENFYEKIAQADQLAREGNIVTFGITPEYPETGYGYIEASHQRIGDGYKIERFVEKPDIQKAEEYIKAGNFYWNAGMFAFKASVLINTFQTHMPDMLNDLKQMIANHHLDEAHYQTLENISFDYAIMEKTHSGVVLPSNFQWTDIGSWKSLYDYLPKDNNKNVIISDDAILQNTQNCLVQGHHRLIVLNRLSNIVLVDTHDALFVSDMDHSRDVKDAVALLKKQNRREYKVHTHQVMHWGDIYILDEQADCVVSKIIIHPGAEIPEMRNILEIKQWQVTSGYGVVKIDNITVQLQAGENVTIENGMTVAFENLSKEPLIFIEISTPIKSVSDDMLFE
ncbi:MAG: mannose-1-phosphate guanylyltransferase/mannose-6-phosphate isomerase [Candidatus Magnetomorum sp.]|nr:mannose-1-phosphate guanylyltransferase/mannose-6-phosphate isomerase [Candidatus Magnetomorum sp.]